MKLRRRLNFHSLKKGRVRQTWNKYNLYNLANVERTIPNFIRRTFFQQKWTAKALTRAYHGEHINERKWQTMFSRRLLSVVNMDPVYMAHSDGAEQAAGRGSGLDKPAYEDVTPWHERGQTRRDPVRGSGRKRPSPSGGGESGGSGVRHESGNILQRLTDMEETSIGSDAKELAGNTNVQEHGEGSTPYMNMAFAPQERRIDVAIFRALFASSVRQARQFVVHGAVKVNGQKMNHPSYLLNPGDMFQVDPECVMLATGKKKPRARPERKSSGRKRRGRGDVQAAAEGEEEGEGADAAIEAEDSAEDAEAAPEAAEASPEADKEQLAKRLKFLSKTARQVLNAEKDELTAKKKQQLRSFIKEARDVSSKLGRKDGEQAVTTDLVGSVNSMLKEMVLNDPKVADKAEASGAFTPEETAEAAAATGQAEEAAAPEPAPAPAPARKKPERYEMSDEEAGRLAKMVQEWEDNPVDESKPYATPWEPRPYMSPFAFIPRYLEVNQNICAAVYLRHPVARQGYAEVPSPFPPPVMQLAFNWYLRRR